MNKINIYTFKRTGKYYTHEEGIIVPEGMMLFHDDFEYFVRNNCGVSMSASYEFDVVVIEDKNNVDGFYMCTFKSIK